MTMPASAMAQYYEYEDITKEIEGQQLDIIDKNMAVKMMAKLDNIQVRMQDLEDYKAEKVRLLDEKINKLERESQIIREGLEAFIVEHNDGENISYPDIGTAYVSQKTKIEIDDEDTLMDHLESTLSEEDKKKYIKIKKSIKKRNFKKYADERLKRTGQLLPGTKQEEKTTFVYRSPR